MAKAPAANQLGGDSPPVLALAKSFKKGRPSHIADFPDYANRRPVPIEQLFPEILPEGKYVEGAVRRVTVSVYERDPKARAECIRRHGSRCVVCGLDFSNRYGNIGRGFIHVHHLKPLASRRREYQLNPAKDLVPVCPNCHAMLHTSEPPLSVDELKSILARATTFRAV